MTAFDPRTRHASSGGRDRLAWNAVYPRCPETEGERDRYPVWRDWLAGAAAHPRRAPVIERMRRVGVLDLPGALEGW